MERIIIVDDEPQVLKALERTMMDEPYQVVTFTNPLTAMEDMAAHKYAVVISDQRMPQMLGTEFLSRIADSWPETVRILLTGYADYTAVIEAINQARVYRFLTKPWDDDELKMILSNAILQYQINYRNRDLIDKALNTLASANGIATDSQTPEKRQIIDGVNLRKLLKRNFHQTIQSLVRLMDIFNPKLVEHGKLVAHLCKYVGMHYTPTELNLEILITSALLHDIGFIGLPKYLSDRGCEYQKDDSKELIRQHSEMGYLVLQEISGLHEVAMIVRAVHENYDGSGYPGKLSRDHIPLAARIIRVVSDYDIFICRGRDREESLSLIAAGKNKRYDPQVVTYFLLLMTVENKSFKDQILVPTKADKLAAGMVVAKNVYLKNGSLLVAQNTPLDSITAIKIRAIGKAGQIVEPIFAYRPKEQ